MQRNYIFRTKDGLYEISIRGAKGLKKIEELKQINPNINIQPGNLVTTITTDIESKEDLEKQILY